MKVEVFFWIFGTITLIVFLSAFPWIALVVFVVMLFLYSVNESSEVKRSRYISDEMKKKVLEHYHGMCAFCSEENFLEFHHRENFADGGENSADNIVPLCGTHHNMVTRFGKKQEA